LAESQRSKAFGWLAFSSALLVLLASGVAISRLGDDDANNPVASAPIPGPTTGAAGDSGAGSAESGDAGAGGVSGPAGATGASDANAATGGGSGTVKGSGGLTGGATAAAAGRRTSDGAGSLQESPTSGGTGGSSTGSDTSGSGTSGSGSGDGAVPPAGGTTGGDGGNGGQAGEGSGDGPPGGGQSPPPAPSDQPPEQDSPLFAASASAGEGAQGGVVGVGVDGTELDVDLTLGRDQLVGNHPPSDGTGVSFGGRLLNPPSVSPAFPTVSG
jgi:hypothetical protein